MKRFCTFLRNHLITLLEYLFAKFIFEKKNGKNKSVLLGKFPNTFLNYPLKQG